MSIGATPERAPDVVLRGTIDANDHQTYKLVPFDVPEGVSTLHVQFDYTGREARSTIDIGLLGPGESFEAQFRGWSGGNKRTFQLGGGGATPSYFSAPVTHGRWQLLLGIPNIRAGQRSEYIANIWYSPAAEFPRGAVIKREPGWYRGDLHSHTAHSDGTCTSRSGSARVACPAFLLLEAASRQQLDFLAVTDHNTTSHHAELTALQPYFDRLVLIPGIEVTTFQGHANVFGVRRPVDFRVGSAAVPDWNALLKSLPIREVLVSINHPRVPSGESCMGCGWDPRPQVDMRSIQLVEAVNGYDAETAKAGVPFWHEQLDRGVRLTAIGGSDVHDATAKAFDPTATRIGVPATVVFASELSESGIMDGLRSGKVFIDVAGEPDRFFTLAASANDMSAEMGGVLASGESPVRFRFRVRGLEHGSIEIIRDGDRVEQLSDARIASNDQTGEFSLRLPGRHWVRLNARDSAGRLALIGNPIYINWNDDLRCEEARAEASLVSDCR